MTCGLQTNGVCKGGGGKKRHHFQTINFANEVHCGTRGQFPLLNTDRVTHSVSFRLMRRGKVLTSTELLCVCGCLKQNQLQNCHTPSASLESSRDLQTFMDREAIKIDNKDSSSNIKQESGITLATFSLHLVVDFKAPESWQRVEVWLFICFVLFCF